MRVVKDVFVVVRFGLGIDRDSHRADFYGAEETVEEFRRIEQQKKHSLSAVYAESAKYIPRTVSTIEKLPVGDAVVSAFDGDVFTAAFVDVLIHEVASGIETLG